MPLYITLAKFTDEGVKNMKDVSRLMAMSDEKLRAAGITVTRYFTIGSEYDVVAIVDAPNDEIAAKVGISVQTQGHVRLRTSRAFTQDEFMKLL